MKLHTGDTVVIISGKDKGKTGTILRVLPAERHVVVTGINMRTRHVKKTFQQPGRILKYEASIDASKVMLVDPKTKKPTRIKFAVVDGKKKRIAVLSGEEVKKVRVPKQAPAKKQAPEEKKTSAKTAKDAAPASDKTAGSAQGKQPFWKKLQFGSAVMEDGGEGHAPQESPIPNQAIPKRSTGRGS